jgi:hydrogenase expression/formation protein HypC
MCLAIPGKIISIVDHDDPLLKKAKVNFSGITKEVSLAYVPEAKLGQYVIVHVGFAISLVHEEEALKVFQYLKEMGELEELETE